MTPVSLWLCSLFAPPLLVVVLGWSCKQVERLRASAVACAATSLVASGLHLLVPELRGLQVAWPALAHPILGDRLLHVTELSTPLISLPAALWLVTVAVTPRARLKERGLQRTALAAAFGTLAFLTDSPALLALCWAASSLLFVFGLRKPERRRTTRVVAAYLAASTFALCSGIALNAVARDPGTERLGLWLILVAVLIRKGIFPAHAWIPEAFDRGRLGPVVLFCAPQLGTYVAATLVVPRASPEMLRTVALLSLVTAFYGAALALFQRDARRALGYLFVSQSALVLAGIDCTSTQALAGALVLWLSSALAFTGMARAVLSLEARRGRLDLDRHHGGFAQMPLLATSFLVLGLACTGFPGTLGFVGQEMLIGGAVSSFPTMGFLTIGASAVTGVAVLRMYFSLFCGSRSRAPEHGLRTREALVFGAVATVLVATGVLPRGIVASRLSASESILQQRSPHASPSPTPRPGKS